MTTVVEANQDPRRSAQTGQSVIEFLLILPLMLGLIVILIRVNSAIQVSIVNQQYARAQALFLAYNSANFPHLNNRVSNLDSHEYNQLVLGVSETLVPAEDTGAPYTPTATTQLVSTSPGADDTAKQHSERRSSVRNWNTVAICTQVNVARGPSGQYKPLLPLSNDAAHTPLGDWALNEGTFFEYCHSPGGIY